MPPEKINLSKVTKAVTEELGFKTIAQAKDWLRAQTSKGLELLRDRGELVTYDPGKGEVSLRPTGPSVAEWQWNKGIKRPPPSEWPARGGVPGLSFETGAAEKKHIKRLKDRGVTVRQHPAGHGTFVTDAGAEISSEDARYIERKTIPKASSGAFPRRWRGENIRTIDWLNAQGFTLSPGGDKILTPGGSSLKVPEGQSLSSMIEAGKLKGHPEASRIATSVASANSTMFTEAGMKSKADKWTEIMQRNMEPTAPYSKAGKPPKRPKRSKLPLGRTVAKQLAEVSDEINATVRPHTTDALLDSFRMRLNRLGKQVKDPADSQQLLSQYSKLDRVQAARLRTEALESMGAYPRDITRTKARARALTPGQAPGHPGEMINRAFSPPPEGKPYTSVSEAIERGEQIRQARLARIGVPAESGRLSPLGPGQPAPAPAAYEGPMRLRELQPGPQAPVPQPEYAGDLRLRPMGEPASQASRLRQLMARMKAPAATGLRLLDRILAPVAAAATASEIKGEWGAGNIPFTQGFPRRLTPAEEIIGRNESVTSQSLPRPEWMNRALGLPSEAMAASDADAIMADLFRKGEADMMMQALGSPGVLPQGADEAPQEATLPPTEPSPLISPEEMPRETAPTPAEDIFRWMTQAGQMMGQMAAGGPPLTGGVRAAPPTRIPGEVTESGGQGFPADPRVGEAITNLVYNQTRVPSVAPPPGVRGWSAPLSELGPEGIARELYPERTRSQVLQEAFAPLDDLITTPSERLARGESLREVMGAAAEVQPVTGGEAAASGLPGGPVTEGGGGAMPYDPVFGMQGPPPPQPPVLTPDIPPWMRTDRFREPDMKTPAPPTGGGPPAETGGPPAGGLTTPGRQVSDRAAPAFSASEGASRKAAKATEGLFESMNQIFAEPNALARMRPFDRGLYKFAEALSGDYSRKELQHEQKAIDADRIRRMQQLVMKNASSLGMKYNASISPDGKWTMNLTPDPMADWDVMFEKMREQVQNNPGFGVRVQGGPAGPTMGITYDPNSLSGAMGAFLPEETPSPTRYLAHLTAQQAQHQQQLELINARTQASLAMSQSFRTGSAAQRTTKRMRYENLGGQWWIVSEAVDEQGEVIDKAKTEVDDLTTVEWLREEARALDGAVQLFYDPSTGLFGRTPEDLEKRISEVPK